MTITYPHNIENCVGEKIIFQSVEQHPEGEKVFAENFVTPGSGPVMHTHWLQDEVFTVKKGRLGYQVMGEPEKFAGEGETIVFKKGVAHRFWNDGKEILHCTGYVQPAHSFVFFLSALFAAQNKSGKGQPEMFDGAYLMTRYASEFDLPEIPKFVKKTIIPLTYFVGKILGKYKHFENAPEPVK